MSSRGLAKQLIGGGDGNGLSLSKIRSALKAAGRERNLDSRALQIQQALRTEQLAAPAAVTAAFAATTRAAVGISPN